MKTANPPIDGISSKNRSGRRFLTLGDEKNQGLRAKERGFFY
jgi:hypothetical protein